jgi:hypothetical protein
MLKGLIHLVLFVFILTSCEEYYQPAMDVVPAILVVDAHLSNDSRQSYVRLLMTSDFYNRAPSDSISGANVKLIEGGNYTIEGYEKHKGYFTFAEPPISGKRYHIRITYKEDIYESNSVTMPPLPTIDSIYTKDVIMKAYRTDAYGVPATIETSGREICIDAPITPTLQYYRFNDRAILQWVYNPPEMVGPPPPPFYGWKSFYYNELFNLTGPKEFNVSTSVRQHPLLALDYNASAYLDSINQDPAGWILIIDQYGITKESYDFHVRLNNQFSAVGNLFDPVQTQVYGNIHCTTNPEKLVLGFFDLNSYRQYRYYFYPGSGPDNQVILRQLNHRDFDIPDQNDTTGIRPVFWE